MRRTATRVPRARIVIAAMVVGTLLLAAQPSGTTASAAPADDVA